MVEKPIAFQPISNSVRGLFCSHDHLPAATSDRFSTLTLEAARGLRKKDPNSFPVPVLCAKDDCRKAIWSVKEFGEW